MAFRDIWHGEKCGYAINAAFLILLLKVVKLAVRLSGFVVKKPSTGEIIAKSANQMVPLKFRGGAKMLSPDAPFPC